MLRFIHINFTLLLSCLAAPRIEYIEMRKKFYWCLSYRITGIPTANRTWFYNGEPLEEDENIQDYAFNSQDGFVTEGTSCVGCLPKLFFLPQFSWLLNCLPSVLG